MPNPPNWLTLSDENLAKGIKKRKKDFDGIDEEVAIRLERMTNMNQQNKKYKDLFANVVALQDEFSEKTGELRGREVELRKQLQEIEDEIVQATRLRDERMSNILDVCFPTPKARLIIPLGISSNE
jgi:uncharacterized coiled-coil DUF342 family protein